MKTDNGKKEEKNNKRQNGMLSDGILDILAIHVKILNIVQIFAVMVMGDNHKSTSNKQKSDCVNGNWLFQDGHQTI